MNITSQFCGLIIILMLLIFYRRQPTMGLASERSFKLTLYSILTCLILDMTACYFISHSYLFNQSIVLFVNKLYLISIESTIFSVLSYTIAEIVERYGNAEDQLKKVGAHIFYVIGIIVTLYLPISTYFDGRYVYAKGLAVYATYCISSLYTLVILYYSFKLRQYIKSKKRHAIIFTAIVWGFAAFIQFFNPKLLIISFAISIGVLIIFFEVENPEAPISRRTGHFSSAVIKEYIDYLYLDKKRFSVMMISFKTTAESNSDAALLHQTIEMLSDFLFTINSAKIFDTFEGYFILVFDNTDFMESTKFKIANYIQSVEDNPDISGAITLLRPFYMIVPDSRIVDNATELLSVLTDFMPNEHSIATKDEIIIDSTAVASLRVKKDVENLVVNAIANNQIEVHYQPIYNVAENKFTSAEALVRIRLSDDKLVMPSEFIPIVEETGRIVALSDAIYRKALSFMDTYKIQRLGIEQIELNLSASQCENPIFPTRFQDLLKKYNVPNELINLEVTETSFLRNQDIFSDNLNKLSSMGFNISLDDFGSGSSNLNYVIDMPVNIIKLDKHLTKEYFNSKRAKAVMEAIVDMAHILDLKIVAEGIETSDQVEAMRILGVDYIQGYYFSTPLPEHEFLKFIQSNNL
ncbi:MAG: EAL domain-containing protein [Pseudobutyrivibrio sp.]|nr:EAL domain-containing protein [Pseudobutyrivibrio sp.]